MPSGTTSTDNLTAVFKAYDVRGTVPDQLDEDLARATGAAYVEVLGVDAVVVGYDMRPSSPGLAGAFADGASAAGADHRVRSFGPQPCPTVDPAGRVQLDGLVDPSDEPTGCVRVIIQVRHVCRSSEFPEVRVPVGTGRDRVLEGLHHRCSPFAS